MSRIWFVTGTDTGVGKTVVTAALAAALRHAGRSPYVVKPAQTGVTPNEPADLAEVRRLVREVPGHEGIRLRAALAPVAAARLEAGELPSLTSQCDSVVTAAATYDVIVEGAGGVLVPLGAGWDLLDLAGAVAEAGQDVGFVVVARAGLGTLNHTALTVAAISARSCPVLGVVIGSWPASPDLASAANLDDLPDFVGVPLLGSVPEGAGTWRADDFSVAAPTWLRLPD